MISVLWRKVLRDLRTRLGSLVALIAIVAIGTGTYVGALSLYRDLDGARHRYYTEKRIADFTVDVKRIPAWAIERVAEMPNVRKVHPRVQQAAMIDLPNHEVPISAIAISLPGEPRPVLNDVLIRTGTWFSARDADETILNDAFATANGIKPGDRLSVRILDRQHHVLVVGTAMSPEFVYVIPPAGGIAPDPARSGVLYFPEAFLQKIADLDGAYNQILGQVHDASPTELKLLLDTIEDRFDSYGVLNTTPIHDQMSVRFLGDEIAGLAVTMTVTPIIFLGVAALVLNILLGRLVAQQRVTIGTLKALGFSSGAITRHFLAYGLIIGLVGGAAGVAFGLWMQSATLSIYRQFYALPDMFMHTYPDAVITGILITVVFALLGTIQGVRKAATLQPAEAMRPPLPEAGNRVLIERVPFIWNLLPFRGKLIIRSIFRNPFRSGVVMLSAAISTALVFAYISLAQSVDHMLHYQFDLTMHQDVTVALSDPRDSRASAELDAIDYVAQVEGQLSIACDLSNGPYQKRVGVQALPAHNRLFTPLDENHTPIVIPDEGLVLTRKLGEILHAQPGDIVMLRPLLGQRRTVRAPVVALVDTYMGLSAYANIDYLSRLIGEDRVVNSLLVATTTGADISAEFLDEVTERPAVIGIDERRRALNQMNETFGETMGIMISIMVFIAGSIAFGSVLNAALVSLSERQREVGTLRVLGYTPRQVLAIFAGESLVINAVGIPLGLVMGIGLLYATASAYNTELYRFPVVIEADLLVLSAVLLALFVLAAQLIVYRMIRKLKWLEVLQVKE